MAAQGAYGRVAKGTDFRRTWDKKEYEERARKKDDDERERMKEADDAMKKGKKPPRRQKEELPRATELMQQRDELNLEKNLNKTVVVAGGRGPGAPGFYCDVCKRTSKDSAAYLNHLNSRSHLRHLGQKTQVKVSTLDQVRAKIASLRESTHQQTLAKHYDFKKRLREIHQVEVEERKRRRETKKKEREERGKVILYKSNENQMDVDAGGDDMMKMMGFSGGFKPGR